jgi:SAM-dependent methyltransferase
VAAELEGREPRGRALDLACGEGRNAIWLAERGWRVTAVDFSDVAIERAAKLAERRGVDVEWICRDLAAYEPPPATFQLVLVAYLQLPAADLCGVLALAAEAMAAEGELLMIGHARSNLTEGVGGPRDPAHLWTPDEIDAALRALGLSVERCEHVRRPVETEDGPREAIDLLVRARKPVA